MSEIKNFVESLAGKPVLVFGLGKSGFATVKALSKAGAKVVVGDDNVEHFGKLGKLDVSFLSDNPYEFSEYAFLILSPGISFTHPEPHDVVKRAVDAGVEIICDVELFSRIYPDVMTIGITGTNGKSTTSALTHHILKEAGCDVYLGGNFGTPVFDLKPKKNGSILVLELSSFQIDLCSTFRPNISAILNLTPDHLDRHGSMENYMAVKERLAEPATHGENRALVIAVDDKYTKQIFTRALNTNYREIIQVSTSSALHEGVFVSGGILVDAGVEVGNLEKIASLKGIHNYQNAAVSYALSKQMGLNSEVIWQAMETFPGLNHRQFLVRTINGVTYVNDSKSTNAAAAAVALGCRNNVYWIVGGRKKKNGLDGLEEFFPRIKHAFLVGEAMEDFADWFDKYGMDYSRCYDLGRAVEVAHKMAQENRGQPGGAGVVLLSPACASFDQYENFEVRGDDFTKLVEALEEDI